MSDAELQQNLQQLLGAGSRTEARILAHLAEVEARQLHLKAAFSSMFDYCLRHLKLSEDEAWRRITAARLARRFPILFELVHSGSLHLTGVCLLRQHLNDANHQQLLSEACGKTRRQIEAMLATRFPRPAAQSSLRRLPSRSTTGSGVGPSFREELESAIATGGPARSPVFDASSRQEPTAKRERNGKLEQLSEHRYRLQLDVGVALKAKLERAGDLMSHANPAFDLALVVERALDSLIEDRDGLRCSYVGADGQRCCGKAFLQIHHEEPWARGGPEDVANLRLLCAAHNRLLAERDFGRAAIAAAIAAAR
jgi:hypothetical protein